MQKELPLHLTIFSNHICEAHERILLKLLSTIKDVRLDCSERETSQKVSFGRARDIAIRVSTASLEYQAVNLHYRDYGNH